MKLQIKEPSFNLIDLFMVEDNYQNMILFKVYQCV